MKDLRVDEITCVTESNILEVNKSEAADKKCPSIQSLSFRILAEKKRSISFVNRFKLTGQKIMDEYVKKGILPEDVSFIIVYIPVGESEESFITSGLAQSIKIRMLDGWSASKWEYNAGKMQSVISYTTSALPLSDLDSIPFMFTKIESYSPIGITNVKIDVILENSVRASWTFEFFKKEASPMIRDFYPEKFVVKKGEEAVLYCDSVNIKSGKISPGEFFVDNGFAVYRDRPKASTEYTFHMNGSFSKTAPIFILPPQILIFERSADKSKMVWETSNSIETYYNQNKVADSGEKSLGEAETAVLRCSGHLINIHKMFSFPKNLPGVKHLERTVIEMKNYFVLQAKWKTEGFNAVELWKDNFPVAEGATLEWEFPYQYPTSKKSTIFLRIFTDKTAGKYQDIELWARDYLC